MHGNGAANRVRRGNEDFFHAVIPERHAANGGSPPMDEDIVAGLLVIAENSVRGIGIVEPEGDVEVALRIEAIDLVKTLGRLAVAFAPLGPRAAACSSNLIRRHQA